MYMIGQAAIDTEDYAMATKRAQRYMRAFFGGAKQVLCTCGETVKFKSNKLRCSNCGKKLVKVEYEEDYGDKLIKTVIDVERKDFTLMQKDFD